MTQPDSQQTAPQFNKRLGLTLFVIYTAIYAAFVIINAVSPNTMEKIVILELNLAVTYGFALIVIALVMSIIYGLLCRTETTVDGEDQ